MVVVTLTEMSRVLGDKGLQKPAWGSLISTLISTKEIPISHRSSAKAIQIYILWSCNLFSLLNIFFPQKGNNFFFLLKQGHTFSQVCVVWHHMGERCVIDLCLCQAKIIPCSHSSCLGTLPPLCPWQWQMISSSQGLSGVSFRPWTPLAASSGPWHMPGSGQATRTERSYFYTFLLPTWKCTAVNGSIPGEFSRPGWQRASCAGQRRNSVLFPTACESAHCVSGWCLGKLYSPSLSSQLAQHLWEAFSTTYST